MDWNRATWVMGRSAEAIAGSGTSHPHDPADLLRCAKYCESRALDSRALTARMAGRSIVWDRLLPEWDNLVALLRREMETRPDGMAPATYAEMKRVINDGIACAACGSTGRGKECRKCKGTGKRCGGQCRAERCYGGAEFCPTCHGRGYTIDTKAA